MINYVIENGRQRFIIYRGIPVPAPPEWASLHPGESLEIEAADVEELRGDVRRYRIDQPEWIFSTKKLSPNVLRISRIA